MRCNLYGKVANRCVNVFVFILFAVYKAFEGQQQLFRSEELPLNAFRVRSSVALNFLCCAEVQIVLWFVTCNLCHCGRFVVGV